MKSLKPGFIPLFLIIFIDTMGYGLIIPVLLRVLHDSQAFLGVAISPVWQNILFGVGVAISPLAFLLFAPVIGAWSDKLGRKTTLMVCLLGSMIGFSLAALSVWVNSLMLLFLGRMIAGAASSSQPIAQAAVTDITSAKEKPFYLAMIAVAMTLAMVAGPLLGGYLSNPELVAWFSNATPFVAAALLVFLNICLLIFFFDETNQHVVKRVMLTWKETLWALTAAFSTRKLRLFLLVFLFYEFAWSLYFQDISLYFSNGFHYSVDRISAFIAYSGLWMSFGLTVIYKIVIRYTRLYPLLIGSLLLSAIGLVGCNFVGSDLWQWIFVVPLSIGVGMAYPTILALMSETVAQKNQGWVMGVASSCMAATWMFSSLLTGVLTNIGLIIPIQTALVAMLLGVVPLLYQLKRNTYAATNDY